MIRRLIVLVALSLLALTAPPANAATIKFSADLYGFLENPPNASPGVGSALMTYDDVAHTYFVEAQWSGLIGTTTVSHIHCCVAPPGTAGVVTFPGTFPGFPVGTTFGSYVSPLIDLTSAASYTAAFLNGPGGGTAAGAEQALIRGIFAGQAYFNIHSTFAPGGEIRGFLSTPEPASLTLLGLGLAGVAARLRSHRRKRP